MSKYYSDTKYSGHKNFAGKPRKNPWIVTLKVFCWCVGILVVLCAIALWIISYKLSPDRIARLIEKESSEYLEADLKIGKLDYKLHGNYPWLKFEVDSLSIISRSLSGISAEVREKLPENADFLASVEQIKGKINIHSLIHKKIDLKDIEISRPNVNLVSVNDSVSNFNIAPKMSAPKKMPQVNIGEVNVTAPMLFNYFSLQQDVEGFLDVTSFYLTQDEDKVYGIGFEGIADGRYADYRLPGKLPLKLDLHVKGDLSSYSLLVKDITASLAGLKFKAKGDIAVNPKSIDLKQADFSVEIEDLFQLLTILPDQIRELVSLPDGLKGNLPFKFNVALNAPFHVDNTGLKDIEFSELPSVTATAIIDEANLEVSPPGFKKVYADDIYLEAVCDFYPDNSQESTFRINELRMNGEGISLWGNLMVEDLLGETQPIEGDFRFSSPVMETLSYLVKDSGIKVKGILQGEVEFSGNALELGKSGLKDLKLSGNLMSRNLNVKSSAKGDVTVRNLDTRYDARIPAYPLTDYKGTKFDLDLKADSLSAHAPGLAIGLLKPDLKIDALDTVSGNPDPDGEIILKLAGLNVKSGGNVFSGENLSVYAKGALNSGASQSYTGMSTNLQGNEVLVEKRVTHTPLWLEYNGAGILQTVMSLVNLNATMNLNSGRFISPAYILPVEIKGLGITTDLNRVTFSASDVALARSSMSLSGTFDGLQPFLTSYEATPLNLTADIDFKNVDINQLAWGYYGALIRQGKDSVYYVAPITPFTAADSTCVVIPRNIDANIRLRAQAAEYMQYAFSPLSTDIIVKGGDATLSRLTVGAPYCTAVVDWTYSTSNLDDIFMNLKANVENFSFEPFYGVFPQLVAKAPELKNFTGRINADVDCRFDMFPDMFMNSPSLKGSFNIKGSDMEFARQGKIERITHLMLIEGEAPIHIRNMDIKGFYHDNLLQVNPFKIGFDEYQIEVGGVNNTAGYMYYHLALEKSPFHLPFGVTLEGKFGNPEIRVGGTRINDYNAGKISSEPVNDFNVNIMAWLKHGWLLFVQEAAKYGEEHQ